VAELVLPPVERLFGRYRGEIIQLPPQPSIDVLCDGRFELLRDGRVAVHYAPVEHVDPGARVVLVGLTPGRQVMREAFLAARAALADGASDTEVLARTKRAAAFAGQMRVNLVAMLDGIGMQRALGLSSSADLFSAQHFGLVNTTSAVRFPLLVDRKDWGGASPRIDRHPITLAFVHQVLAEELAATPRALVVGLGRAVNTALDLLERARQLDAARRLHGFPHPSPGNGHRVAHFADHQASLTAQVAAWASAARPNS
jgi:hypothetical protein